MVTLKETPDGAPVRPCEPGLLVRRMGYLSGCHRQLIPQTASISASRSSSTGTITIASSTEAPRLRNRRSQRGARQRHQGSERSLILVAAVLWHPRER